MVRGRPRGFDAEDALDRVLPVFWRDGFEGASVQALAEAAGVSKPSLYAAYGNKEALFLAALARYGARYGVERGSALDAEADGREAIRGFLYAIVDAYTDPAHPAGCLVVTGTTTCDSPAVPASVRAALCDALRTGADRLACRLARAQRDGQLAATASVETLATYFNTLIAGLGVQAKGGASRDALRAVVDAAMLGWPTA
ncbi:MAG TPA: TetR/AcrR family transcriptional regulator [Gemmatimonadaceae bacterium]|nr:TetR/AcrR family transcriptional regulator [Gemmatimonadaceae bacterium]